MEALSKIVAVAVGGAFGAVGRYLISISPLAAVFQKFPLPTFLINIIGSFLIGFLFIVLTDRIDFGENLRLAVFVGFLGAFTTFSTFEMEIYGLTEERAFWTAIIYLLLSVIVGFVGVVAGVNVAKRF